MTPRQFAEHCGVAVKTVRDWITDGLVEFEKHGTKKQSRVIILSGERERMKARRGTHVRPAVKRGLTA